MASRALACGWIAAVAFSLLLTSPAQADVAYIDGNEVWVSTLDGKDKIRLSSGEGDWRDVAVSDQGFVVGVQLEANKIADLSRFTVWDPQGKRIRFGPLVGLRNGGSNAHPLNLQITPDGGLLVYGFSNFVYGFPVGTLTTGFILWPSASSVVPALSPVNVTAARYPALVGERVVGAISDTVLGVQQPGSPGNDTFDPWPGIDASGIDPNARIDGLDVNSAGTRVAVNVDFSGQRRLVVIPTPGLGQAPVAIPGTSPGDAGDCFVPVTGNTSHPSLSPDGTSLAWADDGGVKVAGTPRVVPTTGPCTMSSAIVTISPTGRYPSLGPVSVATLRGPAPAPAPAPAPGGSGGTQTQPPVLGGTAGLTVAKLNSKGGAVVTVTPAATGQVTVRMTVRPKAVGRSGKKPIVIAAGARNLQAGAAAKVKVTFTKKGKSLRKKLKGKRVTLIITQNGSSTTRTVRLR